MTVMVFFCTPERSPMLKVAVISPLSLGATISLAKAAVVQPQEAWTEVIFTGLSPVFLYLKWATAVLSVSDGCRSAEVVSQVRVAVAVWATKPSRLTRERTLNFFIVAVQKENPKPTLPPTESIPKFGLLISALEMWR